MVANICKLEDHLCHTTMNFLLASLTAVIVVLQVPEYLYFRH